MGSMLGNWPSYDPHNFSQLRTSDPAQPSKLTAVTYHPTHDRALPPPNQASIWQHSRVSTGFNLVIYSEERALGLGIHLYSPWLLRTYLFRWIISSSWSLIPLAVYCSMESMLIWHWRLISTEAANILLRQFYQKKEDKLRTKRAAQDNLMPDHGCKQPRGSCADGPS